MIYAYIRVSTDRQNTNNQRFAINEWAMQNNIDIDYFVDETASGKIAIDHRNLGKLFNKLKNGDTLIVAELSRLGRSMLDVIKKLIGVLKIILKCTQLKKNSPLKTA
ncbi:hypothetical protein AWR29_08695 [Campylobacter fetus subsp. venerealis]|nr:hypothetical protein AWR29_08695 [Campylobacter fetus subsp. venerealis]